jgi:heme A synthase
MNEPMGVRAALAMNTDLAVTGSPAADCKAWGWALPQQFVQFAELAERQAKVYIATNMTRTALGALQTGSSKLTRFAWCYYAYLLFVILFGAWVRISGSGAGCGGSWPTCHGEFMPPSVETKTLIEYSHRATSGTLGLLSIALVAWVWKSRVPKRCKVAAGVTLALVLVEALIGAGLVLRELVADDASVARAVVIALHLGNTLILAAAAGLTAAWSAAAAGPSRGEPLLARWASGTLLAGCMVVSMAGAVTALGDTLFPVSAVEGGSLFAHVRDDLGASAHFLVRLRIIHPLLALFLAGAVLFAANRWESAVRGSPSLRWLIGLRWLTYGQVAFGTLNIALQAPVLMQLGHLLFAHLLWLCLVQLAATPRFAR